MNSIITTPLKIAVSGAVFLLLSFMGVSYAHAEVTCTFDRDLDIGIEGDDVLCLQQFLNEAGYTLTENGAGAPGEETNRFV